MVNTTWSATRLTNVTLTGSSLIATATGVGAVIAADGLGSGKLYWECTLTTLASASTNVGLTSGTINTSTFQSTAAPGIIMNKSGAIFLNNVSTGSTLGARSAGDVICIAVDLDARLIWFRLGPAGNWNGSGAADPATGTGGISFASMTIPALVFYPLGGFGATSDKITANFGDSAFTGTAPSGFTGGFTAGSTPAVDVIITQAGAETWIVPPSPSVDITQLGAEVWVVPPAPALRITQLGIEVWASLQQTIAGASGTGAASGVGRATVEGVGGSSGSGASAATGVSTAAATASAAGTGGSSVVGSQIFSGAGSADGTGTAAGVGSGVDEAVASAGGVGDAAAFPEVGSTGAATGTGDASGVGLAVTAGAGSSDGAGAAAGVATSFSASPASAAGTGAATGVGSATAASTGTSAGLGAGLGVGSSEADATGSSDGVGSASATGAGINAAVASSDGAGAAAGVGHDAAGETVGHATGTGTGAAVGSGVATVESVGAASGRGFADGRTPVDPSLTNVVLLCHFDGTNGSTSFTDVSSYAHTLTATSTTVTTTSPKFGTGSGDFTATSAARINTGNAADFHFGAGQFTVEGWGYFTSTPSGVQAVLSQFGFSSNLGWFFGVVSGALAFYYSTTGSDNPNVGAAYSPTLNTWVHLAADRDALGVLRVYAGGSVVASATVGAVIFPSTQNCLIGNDNNNSRAFPGHLDDVRVTVGLARYAGPFTPPDAPFPSVNLLSGVASAAGVGQALGVSPFTSNTGPMMIAMV